ncbi:MAG: hypothetical protein LQ348_002119 [Seirophora lacunosa]|nr:MAG: hypothetical protein LQ348_002119 [Seirophora lacunosa]
MPRLMRTHKAIFDRVFIRSRWMTKIGMPAQRRSVRASKPEQEDDDLDEVTDSHKSEQNPEELGEPPANPVNEAKYAETHGNFDQTNAYYIENLGQQTPFVYRIDGSPWQAGEVLSAAALNQSRKERSSNETNSLSRRSKGATPSLKMQLTKLAATK